MLRTRAVQLALGALLTGTTCGAGLAAAAEGARCAELAQNAADAGAMDARAISLALFKAADNNCADLIDRLLQQGASTHARDALGRTALIHAARTGAGEAARLLIERGSPIDQAALNGNTALFTAAEADKADVVEMLLAANANVNLLGRSGLSPLAAAAFNADDGVALLLLDHGADATVADVTGKTPILYAAARGRQQPARRRGGQIERGLAVMVAPVGLRARGQQRRHHLLVVLLGGDHQRGAAAIVGIVDARTPL